MVAASRRALLLVGLAAAGLAGCGERRTPVRRRSAPAPTATPPAQADVLRPLIEIKARAVALYAGHAALERLHAQEEEHLTRLLRAAPGRPIVFDDGIAPAELEGEMLAAELAALPRLTDAGMRLLVGGMFATDAEHLAVLRRA
ncbi:MAG: hypothetical protein ACR2NB_11760, partial [Solirubrobacteraceae bacterium]